LVEFSLASENVDRFVPHYDGFETAITGQISEQASKHIEKGGKLETWTRGLELSLYQSELSYPSAPKIVSVKALPQQGFRAPVTIPVKGSQQIGNPPFDNRESVPLQGENGTLHIMLEQGCHNQVKG
jgi:hypothetical protein